MTSGYTTPPSNNPLAALAAMMNGQNPQTLLNNLSPQLAQLLNGRNPQEIEQFVKNEYKKRGVDINAVMKQIQALMGNKIL
jgi:hypothetical protein